jgi:hypothetical protein
MIQKLPQFARGFLASAIVRGRSMTISRRGLVAGLASLIAAPAIVRAESLMPVKAILVPRQLGTVPIKAEGAVIQPLFWKIEGIGTNGCWVGSTVLPVGTKLDPLNRALLEYEEVTSVTQFNPGSYKTENFLTEPMYPQKSWMRDYYDWKDQDDSQLPVERPPL